MSQAWGGGVGGCGGGRSCSRKHVVHPECQGNTKTLKEGQNTEQLCTANGRVLKGKKWWNFTFDAFIFAH